MQSCMVAHATLEEMDKARSQWFLEIEERKKKREKEELKEKEKQRFKNEYWGLDEHGRKKKDVYEAVMKGEKPPNALSQEELDAIDRRARGRI
jgi:hypothetical protein